jgi:hypothetical protein
MYLASEKWVEVTESDLNSICLSTQGLSLAIGVHPVYADADWKYLAMYILESKPEPMTGRYSPSSLIPWAEEF